MAQSLQLLLESILGSEEVHFQPGSNVTMVYPAIVYDFADESVKHADDSPYYKKKAWSVTFIDRDPGLEVPDKISALPLSRFSRRYVAENLYHTVYTLYYNEGNEE